MVEPLTKAFVIESTRICMCMRTRYLDPWSFPLLCTAKNYVAHTPKRFAIFHITTSHSNSTSSGLAKTTNEGKKGWERRQRSFFFVMTMPRSFFDPDLFSRCASACFPRLQADTSIYERLGWEFDPNSHDLWPEACRESVHMIFSKRILLEKRIWDEIRPYESRRRLFPLFTT